MKNDINDDCVSDSPVSLDSLKKKNVHVHVFYTSKHIGNANVAGLDPPNCHYMLLVLQESIVAWIQSLCVVLCQAYKSMKLTCLAFSIFSER